MPSRGSTSQRTPERARRRRRPPRPGCASPGRAPRIIPTIRASASRSASLTRSVRLLLATRPLAGPPKRSSSSAPAARAAATRPGRAAPRSRQVLDQGGQHDLAGASRCGKWPASGTRSSRPAGSGARPARPRRPAASRGRPRRHHQRRAAARGARAGARRRPRRSRPSRPSRAGRRRGGGRRAARSRAASSGSPATPRRVGDGA